MFSFFYNSKKKNLKKNSINVISITSKSGLGRITKLVSNALSSKLKTKSIFLSNSNNKTAYEKLVINNLNILVGNPDMIFLSIYKLFGISIINKYIIGFWFWELSSTPWRWKLLNKLVDEIWVNSDFVMNSFGNHTNKVSKIPFYIELNINKKFTREYFNLPENKFIFIFSFDFLSHFERKNPVAVVNAFLKSFKDNSDMYLIIKSINGEKKPHEYSKLLKFANFSKNIEVRDQLFSFSEQSALISVCDCYVSLHRSEGLGLGMAEAMYLGKPVIATNYSGNLEFMNHKNSCLVNFKIVPVKKEDYIYTKDQYWADPDIEHASFLMRKIVSNESFRKKIARNGSLDIKRNFSKKKFEIFMYNKLDNLYENKK